MSNTLTMDTYVTIQFCPSGDVEERSLRWIMNHGGLRQVQKIKSGKKLDAVIMPDKFIND